MNERLIVKMFAGARERVGSDAIEIQVSLPVSVKQFKEAISDQFESLRSLVEFGRIAIDNEFVSELEIIDVASSQKLIALIPPVSGG